MMNSRSYFARITEAYDEVALELTPCAGFFHRWLLRKAPPGVPIEIELEDFCKKFDYSLKWVKSALNELIEKDLVAIQKKFSGRIFRLLAFYPERETSPPDPQNRPTDPPTSKKQPSNADSLAVNYRDQKETTDKPTHHPVSTNEQEGAIDSQPTSKHSEPETEEPIAPSILQQIEDAGFKMNKTLGTIVRQTPRQTIQEAIQATKQYLHILQQHNKPLKRQPEAILAAALQQQWSVNQKTNITQNVMPPDFNEWFKSAQAVGLASTSSAQADVTGQMPGVLCVQTVSGNWEPFEQMRRLHPLAEVQELLKKKQQEMVFTPSPRLVGHLLGHVSST